MSPTSYQTAPPRSLIIATVPRTVKPARLRKLARSYSESHAEIPGGCGKISQKLSILWSQAAIQGVCSDHFVRARTTKPQ
jgi:hypothetical protein